MNKRNIRHKEELPMFRFRRNYRGAEIYISVSYFGTEFVEMFINFSIEKEYDNIYMEAGWDMFTRVLSVSDLSVDEIIKHAERSSRKSDDLPGIVFSVMKEFQGKMRKLGAE